MSIESYIPTHDSDDKPREVQGELFVLPGYEQVAPPLAEEAGLTQIYPDGRPFVDRGAHPYGRRESDAEIGLGEKKTLSPAVEEVRRLIDEAYSWGEELPFERLQILQPVQDIDEQKQYPYVGFSDSPKFAHTNEAKEKAPKFKIREATVADIPTIVDVDMRAFDSVYRSYPKNSDELRTELVQKFTGRFNMLGGGWMPVLERDGEIVGFMTCCPTSKSPEDFKSWEDTTDNGTLETTYDPNGKNVYIVTLSVLPSGTQAKDQLFINQMGKMFASGQKTAFFESRMPGLKSWAEQQARILGKELEYLDVDEVNYMADTYFNLKTQVKGREVPYDRLLRLYESKGCNLLKVVPNAYKDEPSLDYGVVCTFDGSEFFDGSLLPVKLPDNKFTRKLLAMGMSAVCKSQTLASKLLG